MISIDEDNRKRDNRKHIFVEYRYFNGPVLEDSSYWFYKFLINLYILFNNKCLLIFVNVF